MGEVPMCEICHKQECKICIPTPQGSLWFCTPAHRDQYVKEHQMAHLEKLDGPQIKRVTLATKTKTGTLVAKTAIEVTQKKDKKDGKEKTKSAEGSSKSKSRKGDKDSRRARKRTDRGKSKA